MARVRVGVSPRPLLRTMKGGNMATPQEIALLRDLINEPDSTGEWTDERLAAFIDAASSVRAAAGDVWEVKATSYVNLVDVTESSSSRRLSQAFEHAQKMAAGFRTPTEAEGDPNAGRLRSVRIVRPTRG